MNSLSTVKESDGVKWLYIYMIMRVHKFLLMDGKNKYFMKIKTIFDLNVVESWNSGNNIMIMTNTTVRWVNCAMTNITMQLTTN